MFHTMLDNKVSCQRAAQSSRPTGDQDGAPPRLLGRSAIVLGARSRKSRSQGTSTAQRKLWLTRAQRRAELCQRELGVVEIHEHKPLGMLGLGRSNEAP